MMPPRRTPPPPRPVTSPPPVTNQRPQARSVDELCESPFHLVAFLAYLLRRRFAQYLLFYYQARKYWQTPSYDLLDSLWQEYVAADSPLTLEVDGKDDFAVSILAAAQNRRAQERPNPLIFEHLEASARSNLEAMLAVFETVAPQRTPSQVASRLSVTSVQRLDPTDEQILVQELLDAMTDLTRSKGKSASDDYVCAVAFRTVELVQELSIPTAGLRPFLLQLDRAASTRGFRRRSSSRSATQLNKYLSNPSIISPSNSHPSSPVLLAARSPPVTSPPATSPTLVAPPRPPRAPKETPPPLPPKSYNRPQAEQQALESIKRADCWRATVSAEVISRTPRDEIMRQEAIFEIVRTEQKFLHDITALKEAFRDPLLESGLISQTLVNRLFTNVDEVLVVCSRLYKKMLARQLASVYVETIGDLFDQEFNALRTYYAMCANYHEALRLLSRLMETNDNFADFIRVTEEGPRCRPDRLKVKDLLARPMQSLTRYPLLLSNVLNRTPADHPDKTILTERAIPLVNEICTFVNDRVHAMATVSHLRSIQSAVESISPIDLLDKNRSLVREGTLVARLCRGPTYRHCSDPAIAKEIRSSNNEEVRLVLLNDMLLIAFPVGRALAIPFEPIALEHVRVGQASGRPDCFRIEVPGAGDQSQSYELKAKDEVEKGEWVKAIETAARERTSALASRA